jgi:hypothetical protein
VNTFILVPPAISIVPKSVSSEKSGVISPSIIVVEFPVILISEAGVEPVPCILKLYGFSSLSPLTILIEAVLKPSALGLNLITKVVLPEVATEAAGDVIRVKSPECTPLIVQKVRQFLYFEL